MAYDIVSKFIKNSPLPCWKGFRRKPGTTEFSEGSCERIPSSNKMLSPVKEYVSDEQRKAVHASKADGGAGNANKMLSPMKATRKVCLPKAKIARMSEDEKQKVINAKQTAANKGETRRSSSSNITDGSTKSDGLRDWVKQDWRQVANPDKKCGED